MDSERSADSLSESLSTSRSLQVRRRPINLRGRQGIGNAAVTNRAESPRILEQLDDEIARHNATDRTNALKRQRVEQQNKAEKTEVTNEVLNKSEEPKVVEKLDEEEEQVSDEESEPPLTPRVLLERTRQEMVEDIEYSREELAELDNRIIEKRKIVKNLDNQILDRREDIVALNKQIVGKRDIIGGLEARITTANDEIELLRSGGRTEIIEYLQKILNEMLISETNSEKERRSNVLGHNQMDQTTPLA